MQLSIQTTRNNYVIIKKIKYKQLLKLLAVYTKHFEQDTKQIKPSFQ